MVTLVLVGLARTSSPAWILINPTYICTSTTRLLDLHPPYSSLSPPDLASFLCATFTLPPDIASLPSTTLLRLASPTRLRTSSQGRSNESPAGTRPRLSRCLCAVEQSLCSGS